MGTKNQPKNAFFNFLTSNFELCSTSKYALNLEIINIMGKPIRIGCRVSSKNGVPVKKGVVTKLGDVEKTWFIRWDGSDAEVLMKSIHIKHDKETQMEVVKLATKVPSAVQAQCSDQDDDSDNSEEAEGAEDGDEESEVDKQVPSPFGESKVDLWNKKYKSRIGTSVTVRSHCL